MLIEAEPFSAHKRPEIGSLRYGVLAGLVLGPAVRRSVAPALRIPLAKIGPCARPAPIIVIDLTGKFAIIK